MGNLKLSDNVLSKRVFKQQILDLHLKDFMIGQTTPYLNKFKNTLDIGIIQICLGDNQKGNLPPVCSNRIAINLSTEPKMAR